MIQAPRGTKDLLPDDSRKFREIEDAVRSVAESFGYGEIRTPMFESVKLFKRAVGEETDIVSKEMYLFADKGGEEFALRPELTAPVVRAAIEHSLVGGQAVCQRLFYNSAPSFRYEKPQLGRQRQFHQFGTELLGPTSALADAETIAFPIAVFRKLGLSNFTVRLNSLASPSARTAWKEVLVPYLVQHSGSLSADSQRRTNTNPMRVLDSKLEQDRDVIQNAPRILDYLTPEDNEHFEQLQSALRSINIDFVVDPLLVRGIDYYTRTVFEVMSSDLGAQDTLCGGGRYDVLVEQLDGAPTPAVGFGAGVERVMIALEKKRGEYAIAQNCEVYVVAQSPLARMKTFELTSALRNSGAAAICDLNERSMKAQMREANRLAAKHVFIIGESELASGEGILKEMATGEQRSVQFADLDQSLFSKTIGLSAE